MPSAKIWWRHILAIAPVAHIKFSIGFALGWIAPILKARSDSSSFLHLPPLTADDVSWIASLHELGRCFGGLSILTFLDELSYKSILITSGLIFSVTWLTIAYIERVSILYFARFVFGIGLGMYDTMSSDYLNENCVPELKRTFNNLTRISFYLGLLIQFILTYYFPYRVVLLINLGNAVLVNLSTDLLVEPFLLLLAKGKEIEARYNFMWLRGETDWNAVSTEFQVIRNNVEDVEPVRDINSKAILALLLSTSLAATGHCAIIAYCTFIVPPSESFSSHEFAIFYGVVALLTACVSSTISKVLDSKAILQLMFPLIFIVHLYTTLLFYKQTEVPVEEHSWWILFSLGCFSCVYAFLESAISSITEELLPQRSRLLGGCLMVMIQGAVSFVVIKLFFVLMDYYEISVSFITLAYVGFVMDFFMYLFLSQTCFTPRLHAILQ